MQPVEAAEGEDMEGTGGIAKELLDKPVALQGDHFIWRLVVGSHGVSQKLRGRPSVSRQAGTQTRTRTRTNTDAGSG